MRVNHFSRRARHVVVQARTEAGEAGNATIEAEHLLLALTLEDEPAVTSALAAAGLDHDGVIEALEWPDPRGEPGCRDRDDRSGTRV